MIIFRSSIATILFTTVAGYTAFHFDATTCVILFLAGLNLGTSFYKEFCPAQMPTSTYKNPYERNK